jgi:hypothetical protein
MEDVVVKKKILWRMAEVRPRRAPVGTVVLVSLEW